MNSINRTSPQVASPLVSDLTNSNYLAKGKPKSAENDLCQDNMFTRTMRPTLEEVPDVNSVGGMILDRFTGIPQAAHAISDDMCNGKLGDKSAYTVGRAAFRTGASAATLIYATPPLVVAGGAIAGLPGAVIGGVVSIGLSLGAAELAESVYDWGLSKIGSVFSRIAQEKHQ